jgi:hypothetical protein
MLWNEKASVMASQLHDATVLERHARSTCVERLTFLAEQHPHNLLTARSNVKVRLTVCQHRAEDMVISASICRIPATPSRAVCRATRETRSGRPTWILPSHYRHTENSHPIGPCPSHHSVPLVHSFGKWNVFVADLRKGLYGRVVRHGDSRRALAFALEFVLAVHTHGWIDQYTPRRR